MRPRKLALLGGGLLAVLLVAGLPSLGQGVTDPSGELADAECYGHHKAEGFRSMDLFPLTLAEVPAGQAFEFQLTIRNPWLHELRDVYGYVNVSDAPGIQLEGGKPPVEEPGAAQVIEGRPDQYVARDFRIPVEENATQLIVSVAGEPGEYVQLPRTPDLRNDFDLTLTSPEGDIVLTGPDPNAPGEGGVSATAPTWAEEIRVSQAQLLQAGPGEWTASVAYRGQAPQGRFTLSHAVYYNQTGVILMPGPAVLMPNEEHTFTFTLVAKDERSLQTMRYGGLALAYHEHTDKNIGDEGNFDKWNTLQFETGSELRVTSGPVVPTGGADLLGPVLRRWAQVLGFTGSFLILPSLVFGGTFGKQSVVTLNRWFGGPRRRVLFHNSMSFWLLGVSLLHMLLFLYEAFWSWSHGLVWGGLALACMIGLGVTGATQRSFVAKWGFNRWRFVHFAMGVLVVVFVLVHMVADGSHLAPVRDALFGGSAKNL